MTVGVFFCGCGGIVTERVDVGEIERRLVAEAGVEWLGVLDLACSEEGRQQAVDILRDRAPRAVVFAACSPRDHEETFRKVLADAGMNPFLMQLANVREHVAWVTADREAATRKAIAQIRGAVERVRHHEPLETREIDIETAVVVVGGGPAGLAAALTLAEGGRRVTLVEKQPILGGLPVRYEAIFPGMECGPCVLEPLLMQVLRGGDGARIETLLQSEVEEVVGSFGAFRVRIRRRPRFVDTTLCIGCSFCIPPCPVSTPDPSELGLGERKAIDYVFFGGLPNAPWLDPEACLRSKGEACDLCLQACPIPGAVRLDDEGEVTEREAGSIVLAVGGALRDLSDLPALGHGRVPGVRTSLELERLLSTNGPTGGKLEMADGGAPRSVGFVHCVGSLDPGRADYCSGVCCLGAFKLNDVLARKFPGVRQTHYVRTLVAPGKEEAGLMNRVLANPETSLVRFDRIDELAVEAGTGGGCRLTHPGGSAEHDLVVLMPAVVPAPSVAELARRLEVGTDQHGFFEERHGRVDPTRTKVRGVHIAGSCQGPMEIPRAMTQGMSAAGQVLAALVPGRRLQLEAIHAEVDADRCSGCRSCVGVCPFRAISIDAEREVAEANPVLCVGCGTCVATCPAAAIRGKHFTDRQLFAEIEGLLA